MAIAALYNQPSDEAEFGIWGFSHLAHHRDINRVIYEIASIRLDEYALDPVNPMVAGKEWEQQHQSWHNAVNEILGTGGFNLLNIEWGDGGKLASFIQSNAAEHMGWSDLLGVG
jgi:hypothetical protein